MVGLNPVCLCRFGFCVFSGMCFVVLGVLSGGWFAYGGWVVCLSLDACQVVGVLLPSVTVVSLLSALLVGLVGEGALHFSRNS